MCADGAYILFEAIRTFGYILTEGIEHADIPYSRRDILVRTCAHTHTQREKRFWMIAHYSFPSPPRAPLPSQLFPPRRSRFLFHCSVSPATDRSTDSGLRCFPSNGVRGAASTVPFVPGFASISRHLFIDSQQCTKYENCTTHLRSTL